MSLPSVRVKVKQGTVIGGTGILPNGKTYNFFKGIPYAEPPLGKLRFKAPVPLKSFVTSEIECLQDGNVCFQKDEVTGKYIGSEDCLFLNVYTPKYNSEKVFPVLFFIHGGGFISGSGSSKKLNPLYLMQEDIVVVTINYRLGPLGFLSFPDGNIPGNAGLKDQRLALEWVNENISKFGGDEKNVTIFGHSAGSACAHIHVLSKKTKHLIHKAILHSCFVNMEWFFNEKHEKTITLAKSLGCLSSNPNKIIEFLQQYEDLAGFFDPIYSPPRIENVFFGFDVQVRPIIENDSEEAVFTKEIFESFRVKNSMNIPHLIGCTSADGSVVLPIFMKRLDNVENLLNLFVPNDCKDLNKSKKVEMAIKKFYFKNEKIDIFALRQLNNLLTDYLIMKTAKELAEIHSVMNHDSPLYFYIFNFVGDLNLQKKKFKLEKLIDGAIHGDELHYLFQSIHAPEPWNPREKMLVESMCRMWANFVKFGQPCEDWKEIKKVNDASDFELQAFHISDEMRMVENPYGERMNFWRDLKKNNL